MQTEYKVHEYINKLHECKQLTQTQHEHNRLKPNIKVRYTQHTFTNTSAETLGCAKRISSFSIKSKHSGQSRFSELRSKPLQLATSVSSINDQCHYRLSPSSLRHRRLSSEVAGSCLLHVEVTGSCLLQRSARLSPCAACSPPSRAGGRSSRAKASTQSGWRKSLPANLSRDQTWPQLANLRTLCLI